MALPTSRKLGPRIPQGCPLQRCPTDRGAGDGELVVRALLAVRRWVEADQGTMVPHELAQLKVAEAQERSSMQAAQASARCR